MIVHRALRHLLHETGVTVSSPDQWRAEVLTNNLAHEAVLQKTTSLPKAGEINAPYLVFLDEVVEGWRLGGGGSDGATAVVEVSHHCCLSFSFPFPFYVG